MARHLAWLLLRVSVAMAACLVLAVEAVNFGKGSTGVTVLEDGSKAIFSTPVCKTLFLDCSKIDEVIKGKTVCAGTGKVLADKSSDASKYGVVAESPVCNATWKENFMTTLDHLEKSLEEAVASGLAVKENGKYNLLVAKGACQDANSQAPSEANVFVYCKGPSVPTPSPEPSTPSPKPSSAVSRESIVVWMALVVMLLFDFGKFT